MKSEHLQPLQLARMLAWSDDVRAYLAGVIARSEQCGFPVDDPVLTAARAMLDDANRFHAALAAVAEANGVGDYRALLEKAAQHTAELARQLRRDRERQRRWGSGAGF